MKRSLLLFLIAMLGRGTFASSISCHSAAGGTNAIHLTLNDSKNPTAVSISFPTGDSAVPLLGSCHADNHRPTSGFYLCEVNRPDGYITWTVAISLNAPVLQALLSTQIDDGPEIMPCQIE